MLGTCSIPRLFRHFALLRALVPVLAWLFLGATTQAAELRLAQGTVVFPVDELVIETANGQHHFTVELALSPQQQAQGLMFRQSLASDHGMLFDFGQERMAGMWMRNTFIPLDMLFIGRDGRIRRIAADTTPLSEATISSGVPVRAVLELAAGTSARLGIAPGDRVRHRFFQ